MTEPANVYPVCEAKSGAMPGPYGFEPVYCGQTRGLRYVEDANGHRHWFCGSRGHESNVRRWVERNYPVERSPGELTMEWGR